MEKVKTRSLQVADKCCRLLQARNPLIWVVTKEEARAESFLFEACLAAKFLPHTWDCAAGCADMSGKQEAIGSPEIGDMLNAIRDRTKQGTRDVFIMRDLPVWLTGPMFASQLRQVRNLARTLPGVPLNNAQAMIVISPTAEIPAELQGHATVIEWPLPDRAEIAELVDQLCEQYKLDLNGQREAAIDAVLGLSYEEAQAVYSESLVQTRTIDPKTVASEKKRVIARERVLEWHDPLPGGLGAVGGLDNLKTWLITRSAAYSAEAREYGLPAPRGALLVGVPGCGKSLSAKAIATAWGVPLLRLDLGSLKSKYVGESEGNLRKALRVIEAIGRCVVWIDEIEKALAGATDGAADGGVSQDALGSILSWMQERQGQAFVLATANDVSKLPPELLRKGRFDEIFAIDLPTATERVEILAATLRKHGRADAFKAMANDIGRVVEACDGFTGSEVSEIVPDSMFVAFNDGKREITAEDLIASAKQVVPLAKTAADKIERLREWGRSRARPATTAQAAPAERRRQVRALDLGKAGSAE